MLFLTILLFTALVASFFFMLFRSGPLKNYGRIFRIFTVIFTVAFFSYLFIKNSIAKFSENALVVQIINKLPQPLDFYILKVNEANSSSGKLDIKHLGNIRTEFYRLDYLKMDHSSEFWIAGYLGKKNMVYFSQHSVPNKNIDQIIEVRNYINQSMKLSDEARKSIESYQLENIRISIWVTLDLLLLFLNIVLLVKRK